MLDTVRFEGALALGFGGNEEAAMLRLRELLTQTLDPEEKGWVILYEATFLGRLHRVAEARDRVVDLRQLWQGVVEYDARIAVLEAFLDESEGERLLALTKLDAVLKKFAVLWNSSETRDLYEEIQFTRGRLLVYEDRWADALPILEESLRFERPKADEFFYNLGYCYFRNSEYGKAEEFLNKAVGGSTSTGSALEGLGDTSPEGLASTGLTVAGFIPGLGQASAIGSILVDIYKTAKAIGKCN